jgi:phage shock protein PspC (stress-responsive transcriptional regulator)
MLGPMDAPSDLGSPGVASPPPPPEGQPGPRRLRRRPDDGHIAGVCAGIAEYFNVDPVIVRIAAVVLLISGPGFFAYVLAWIFVPAEPGLARYGEPLPPVDKKDRATQIMGIVLLGLGVSVIWGDWWAPARGWLFPLGLMALGGWLLLRPDRDDDDIPPVPPVPPVPPTPAWGWTPPATTMPVAPEDADPTTVSEPADGEELVGDHPAGSDDLTNPDITTTAEPGLDDLAPDATAVQPTTDTGDGGAGWGTPPPTAPWDMPPPPVPGGSASAAPEPDRHDRRHRHRHRHLLGPGVFGVLLIWTGVAWLGGVGLTTGLAVGLVILGLGFVLGSFVGGSRALIFPALVVGFLLVVTAFVDIPFSGPIGEQHWSPDTRVELDDTYEVSMGEGTLDLSGMRLLELDTDIHASVGLGHLIVIVRDDQEVIVNTDVGAGEADVFGEQQNGVGFETHDHEPGDGGTLTLDLEVGMGQIEVRSVDPDEAPDPVLP